MVFCGFLMVAFVRTSLKLDPNTKFKNYTPVLNNLLVSDFWQWAYSDLLQNTTRGVLAEYIVAVLLGVDSTPRNPWLPFDLKLVDGTTVEVKTMSRLQAWTQKQLSEPKVVISARRSWDPDTGIMEQTPTLNADVYVICYFTCEDYSVADPLDLEQWLFFVLDKKEVSRIIEKSKSISIKILEKINRKPVKAHEILSEILLRKAAMELVGSSPNFRLIVL
jgi:hypothetical protein